MDIAGSIVYLAFSHEPALVSWSDPVPEAARHGARHGDATKLGDTKSSIRKCLFSDINSGFCISSVLFNCLNNQIS